MVKATIIEKQDFLYIVEAHGIKKEARLEFYDINFEVTVGDSVYMNQTMWMDLDQNLFAFGTFDDPAGLPLSKAIQNDIIALSKQDNQKVYLKRLYG